MPERRWEWARVYARGKRWYADYALDGERVRASLGAHVTTRRQAEIALREIVMRADRGVPQKGAWRFVDALDDWVLDKKDKREKRTSAGYATHVKQIQEHFGSEILLSAVTARGIEAYLRGRVADGLGKATANKHRTTLGTFFRRAVQLGLCDRNPVEAVEPYSVRAAKKRPAGRADVASLLRALRNDPRAWARATKDGPEGEAHARGLLRDALRLVWHTGLRIGEVCGFTAADVDLDAGGLRVQASRVKGGERWTAIPRAALRLVTRLAARAKGGPLLATLDGKGAYNRIMRFRASWVEQHPEHRAAHFHLCRHAYASRAEDADVDPVVRSAGLLGHATIQMTAHYSHRAIDKLRAAQEKIAESERAARIAKGRSRPT